MSSIIPNSEIINANMPIKSKSSPALPINLVDSKKEREQATPPKGEIKLLDNLFSLLFFFILIFFEILYVKKFKIVDKIKVIKIA